MQVVSPFIKVLYNSKDISEDVSRGLYAVTYSDSLEDIDTIDIDVEDADLKWQNNWYPDKNSTLTVEIGDTSGIVFKCGVFEIDEMELMGPPDAIRIRGIAAGFKTGKKRSAKNHVHENKTLAQIVHTVAESMGLTVQGQIENIKIKRRVQNAKTDLDFLKSLSSEYGYIFNVRGSTLIFIKATDLEKGNTVITLERKDLINFSFRDKNTKTFKSARIKFHDPETGKTVTHTEGNGNSDSDDTLEIKKSVQSSAQAKAVSRAALHKANKKQKTGSITVKGSPYICAGNKIKITQMGKLSGDYMINQANHTLTNDGGWTADAEIYKL